VPVVFGPLVYLDTLKHVNISSGRLGAPEERLYLVSDGVKIGWWGGVRGGDVEERWLHSSDDEGPGSSMNVPTQGSLNADGERKQ